MLFVGRKGKRTTVDMRYYGVLTTTSKVLTDVRRLAMTPRPGIDHWYGRKVEEVGVHHEGDGGIPASWYVQLEDGARIYCDDTEVESPDEDELVGKMLVNISIDGQRTTLYFRTPNSRGKRPIGDNNDLVSLAFNPLKYRISDPNYEGGEPFNPQQSEIVHGTPPEPVGRTQSGPESNAESS